MCRYVAFQLEFCSMTAEKCQELANQYKAMARSADLSEGRAVLLKNIARSYAGLASQLDRLAALTRDEARVR